MPIETKITRQDLQIYKAERNTDTPDGGGLMTSTALTGAKNELFNPVDNMQRLNGGLSMRKIFPAVLRDDDEPALGANIIIARPPETPNWSFLAFKAASEAEERDEAASRLATYIIKTIPSRMTLLANATKDSRVVQVYQDVDAPLPRLGEVYCLDQEKLGYETAEQYIRVESTSDEVRTFTDATGKDFSKRVITIITRNKLETAFVGMDYPVVGKSNPPCVVRETHVTDSANFYGVKRAKSNVIANAYTAQVDSLFEKLVPTNNIETPLPNQTISGASNGFLDAAKTGTDGVVTLSTSQTFEAGTALYTGSAITPNSLKIVTGTVTFSDSGGQLLANGAIVGTVDYGLGLIQLADDAQNYGGTKTISFRPAGAVSAASDMAMIEVTTSNRMKTYVKTISPSPTPGSLSASYCAQGKWYTLIDDGAGNLKGTSEEHGTGTFATATDTLTLTLQVPPDVDTAIIITWATSGNQFNRASEVAIKPELSLELPEVPTGSTLQITHDGGTTSDDGAGDVTGGGLMGTLAHNAIDLSFTTLPAHGSMYDIAYSTGAEQVSETTAPSGSSNGVFTLQLGKTNIIPRSFKVETQVTAVSPPDTFIRLVSATSTSAPREQPVPINRAVGFSDDGNGNVKNTAGTTVGTIDYAAGVVTINPAVSLTVFTRGHGGIYSRETLNFTHQGAAFACAYTVGTATSKAVSHVLDSLTIKIVPRNGEYLVANSIVFTLGGLTYYDKNGKLYHSLNPATGQGTPAGIINYQTGVAIITDWVAGQNSDCVLTSLLTVTNAKLVDAAVFRVPVTPISVPDFQLLGTLSTGVTFDVTANADGTITGDYLRGRIDGKTGIARIQFGAMVDAAGNENEDWYDDNDVVDGQIWRPTYAYPESLRYNATGFTSVPMDNTGLGVDTARLPSDGYVPIYRPGDSITIASRWRQDLGSAFSAGQAVQLNQTDLTVLCLQDSNNQPVEATLYDINLAAGVITFNDAIDPATYQLPLIAKYAYEEDNVVTGTDIDGTLTLKFPIKRAFDKSNCFISSILRASGTGNLEVRATEPFEQRTWDNVWSDERRTDEILAKLDTRTYPIVLTDNGAMTERWLIKFSNDTQFELYGETLGLVAKADILEDLSPINPATGFPIFTLDKRAFSSGGTTAWAEGNCIRFNTYGTAMPMWIIRAVQPSQDKQTEDDGYALEFRADTVAV